MMIPYSVDYYGRDLRVLLCLALMIVVGDYARKLSVEAAEIFKPLKILLLCVWWFTVIFTSVGAVLIALDLLFTTP